CALFFFLLSRCASPGFPTLFEVTTGFRPGLPRFEAVGASSVHCGLIHHNRGCTSSFSRIRVAPPWTLSQQEEQEKLRDRIREPPDSVRFRQGCCFPRG